MEEVSYDDINTAFKNSSLNHSIIKETTNSEKESRDSVLSTFKPLVLSVIDIRDKKKHPDVESIYNHIIKTQAFNADTYEGKFATVFDSFFRNNAPLNEVIVDKS